MVGCWNCAALQYSYSDWFDGRIVPSIFSSDCWIFDWLPVFLCWKVGWMVGFYISGASAPLLIGWIVGLCQVPVFLFWLAGLLNWCQHKPLLSTGLCLVQKCAYSDRLVHWAWCEYSQTWLAKCGHVTACYFWLASDLLVGRTWDTLARRMMTVRQLPLLIGQKCFVQ
jgi:hypothetical protein